MSTEESKRFQHYSAVRASGKAIRFEAVLICPLCENAYHIDMGRGASHNHCGAVACRLSFSGQLRIADNVRRLRRYYKQKALHSQTLEVQAVAV